VRCDRTGVARLRVRHTKLVDQRLVDGGYCGRVAFPLLAAGCPPFHFPCSAYASTGLFLFDPIRSDLYISYENNDLCFHIVHMLLLKIVQKMMHWAYVQAASTVIRGGVSLEAHYGEVVREERREGFAQYAEMIVTS
jgi:hypothetical protein